MPCVILKHGKLKKLLVRMMKNAKFVAMMSLSAFVMILFMPVLLKAAMDFTDIVAIAAVSALIASTITALCLTWLIWTYHDS